MNMACTRSLRRSLSAARSLLQISSVSLVRREFLHERPFLPSSSPQLHLFPTSNFRPRRPFSSEATRSNVISIKAESEYLSALALAQDNGGLGVVYFTAQWCGPCKMISPVVNELSAKYDKATFLKVDIDQEELNKVVSDASVTSVPTFKFFQAGKPVGEIVGANATELKTRVADLCKS